MVAPTDYANVDMTPIATHYLPELDPPVLALCTSARLPTWVVSNDPMLEELATLLIVSQPVGVPKCPPTPVATS